MIPIFGELILDLSLSFVLGLVCFAISKIVETSIPYCKSDTGIKMILLTSTLLQGLAFILFIIFLLNLMYLLGIVWGIE